jgi:prevent-host-death family protein
VAESKANTSERAADRDARGRFNPPQGNPTRWKLEDAKSSFYKLVRRAHIEGPQLVTVRRRRSVVVISAADFDRLESSGVIRSASGETRELDKLAMPYDPDTHPGG